MTRGTESPPQDPAGAPDGAPPGDAPPAGATPASVFDELLALEPPDGIGPVWRGFSPLVSWLVTTTGPALTVELGPGDRASLLSTGDAVARVGDRARCVAVRLPGPGALGAEGFASLVETCAARYPGRLEGHGDGALNPDEVVGASRIDLLHLALLDLVDTALPDLDPWFEACAPGATIVVTATSAGTAGAFTRAARAVADRYPSVRVPTGGATEALVAQVPVEGLAPTVDLLRSAPPSVERHLALVWGGRGGGGGGGGEEGDDLGDEPLSLPATRALIGALRYRQDVERAALLSAVQAYRDHAAALSTELAATRSELAAQTEAARLEREHLVEEFLERLDVLTAKISTSAARYSAELEDKDRELDEQEQRLLVYAGQAATAQSVIDDIHRSTSWRVTAPLRLFSRLMARRQTPRAR